MSHLRNLFLAPDTPLNRNLHGHRRCPYSRLRVTTAGEDRKKINEDEEERYRLIVAEDMVGVRHVTNLYLKRLADILDIEITQRDIRGMSIVGSSKKSLHNDQPICGGIIVTYRSYSIRRRGERTEEKEEEEEEKEEDEEEDGLYLFG
ncbi:hypothetical protein G5I_05285 [Acromyrmex echinatior]|uniref:Uncharacterized protein n=1 Tax=Acromyrmex echinatior TaxID=103372 RepID=F4WI16_ACREC|nr:hypothetical protein G5I_05285 [Acromyrmex echinatior]